MGRTIRRVDIITAGLLFVIGTFGLFLLLTINPSLFTAQLIFFLIGFAIMIAVSQIDVDLLWWLAPFLFIFANILLVASYFGPTIRGSTRWIMLGSQQLQPSELVKPLLILAWAYFIAKYPPRSMKNIGFHCVLFSIPFFLVFKQPDLGTSLVYATTWLSMMIAGGLSIVYVVIAFLTGIFAVPVLWQWLAGYQKSRILTFLNPSYDPKGAGYNAIQATIAVGSGMVFGRGLGRGTQSHLRFLPEYHTDFIYATLVEELGFIGGIALLAAYALLLWRLIGPLMKKHTMEPGQFIFTIGLFAMILTQITINVGMNIGIIPVTGITLPFVSYGGSSLLSITIGFGLLWAIQAKQNESETIANTTLT